MQTQESAQLTDHVEWLARRATGSDGAGAAPEWVHDLRARGLERFRALGFPTAREEEWRALDLSPITRGGFEPAVAVSSTRGLSALETLAIEGTVQLVFVDGTFSRELSTARMPAGLRATSLADALRSEPALVRPHLGRHAGFEKQAFTALNTAFLLDGACVLVAPDAVLERPVHLVFVSSGAGRTMTHPRVLVVAGAGSQCTVIESHVGLAEGEYFTNAVTEIDVGENASVEHVKVQREGPRALHVSRVQVRQAATSRFTSHVFTLGGALTRNDLGVGLVGEGSECALYGLYAAGDSQVVDNHTSIDHASPHCSSRETYKGVLGGAAKAVFNGRILVRKDAQKTNAAQSNPNLLLSDDATLNTRPQLEILADDVKCTHGAAIGRMDADAVFYLRARGIAEEEARTMLTRAFAVEMLDRLHYAPLRSAVDELLGRKLGRLGAAEGERAGERV